MGDALLTGTVLDMPRGYGRGAPGPWWAKIALKLVLSSLPLGYGFWSRVGLFRHGSKDKDLDALVNAFKSHLAIYRKSFGRDPDTLVEIGPGDSLGHAVCAAAVGATACWLIDAGDFAETDPRHYREVAGRLRADGFAPPDLDCAATRGDILTRCRSFYLTGGLDSLRGLAPDSIDLIFSEAVVEHLPLSQFDGFLSEMFRVLKPGGIGSHGVDLADHLGGSLNHLRVPGRLWEFPPVTRAGFYTNRLRFSAILQRARDAGFAAEVEWVARWPELPLPRRLLSREFRDLTDEDLRVGLFGMVLRKPAAQTV